ncbi:MAG: hypothetical protein IPM29_25690 [Planctomycetes bacterium]|nr:hypothetical protein [Planctomycetota bacterium]
MIARGANRRALCAVLLLTSQASAQSLAVRLAPDPSRSGPPGWVRAREALVPMVAAGVDGPWSALRIRARLDASVPDIDCEPDPEPLAGDYLRFALTLGDRVVLHGRESARGEAVWSATAELCAAELPSSLRQLLRVGAFEASNGWLELDVPARIAALAPPFAASSTGGAAGPAPTELLSVIALDCGDVAVLARGTPDGGTVVHARGPSGLLLPTLAAWWASDAAATDAGHPTPPLADDLDRWLAMLQAARGDERAEAARQLGRFDDPRAVDALALLLFEGDELSDVAVLALLGSPSTTAREAVWRAIGRLARRDPELARAAWLGLAPPELADTARVRDRTPTAATRAASMPADDPRSWRTIASAIAAGLLGFLLGRRQLRA